MERLSPTVDLYVQALIEENQRLRRERAAWMKRTWEARQSRDVWKAKVDAMRRGIDPRAAGIYSRHHKKLKAAA